MKVLTTHEPYLLNVRLDMVVERNDREAARVFETVEDLVVISVQERLDSVGERSEHGATFGTLLRNGREVQQVSMEGASLNEMSTVGGQGLGRRSGHVGSVVEHKLVLGNKQVYPAAKQKPPC